MRAARTLKCAERLESPDEQAACRSLFFPGERATGTSLKADPGGTLLLRSPPADLRGDTGHPMVVGWASWLPPAIPACVEVHPRGEQGRLCAGFGLREGECLLVKPQHPPELGPGARLGGSAALPCPLLGDGSQGHTPVTRGRWWPRRCPVIGGLLSRGPGGAGSWPCPARSWAQSCLTLCDPMDYSPWNSPGQNTGVGSRPPSLSDLPNPGIKPRSSTLQADSLPDEPQGKPENTGVGSLSALQQIFLTQEWNWGLLHCRKILYQLSYPGSSPLA